MWHGPVEGGTGGSHLASGASISSQAANPGQSTEEAILNKARRQIMRPLQRVHRYGLWSGHTGSSGSSAWKASLWRYTLPGHLSGAELLLLVRDALTGFLGWGRSYHPMLSSGGHSFPVLLSKVGGAVNSGTLSAEWAMLDAVRSPTTHQPSPYSVLIFPLTKCWRNILNTGLKVCTAIHYPTSCYTQYNPVIRNDRSGVRETWARIPTTT